ncbi:MAG: TorF family putative porin, partial [Paracoccaceae bacterium]
MRLITLVVAGLALPVLAHAETTETDSGVTLTGSLTFGSAYVSDGIEYSDGPVIQPYVELGYGGFYAGVWASNAEETLLGDDTEIDFYIGYRGEAGVFYYDVGYGYYTYPNASEFNAGEVLISGGAGLSE